LFGNETLDRQNLALPVLPKRTNDFNITKQGRVLRGDGVSPLSTILSKESIG